MTPAASASIDRRHAFPIRQMIVLGLCRICEPIAFMSIFPYIYYMIDSFHITHDGRQIALYAGLVTSAFAFAECLAGPFWGRLSDTYGRKPILLSGIAGTGLSMLLFGFARDLPTAIVARALGGLLNGNIGVLQTTVAEVVTVEAHQARAYAIMPFVWCIGSIVGAALGGALADPVHNYPASFAPGTLLDRYPYLLTNLVCAAVVVFSLIVGLLFLEETHEDRKARRDLGLELGSRLGAALGLAPSSPSPSRGKGEDLASVGLIVDDDPLPQYRSLASSPTLAPTSDGWAPLPPEYRSVEASPRTSEAADGEQLPLYREDPDEAGDPTHAARRAASVSGAFTKQVVLNIIGYGIMAYHTISAEQLLPVLFSMPASDAPAALPFRFTGGFALSTKTIGAILAGQAVVQMVATVVVFPLVSRRLGSLTTYRLVVLTYPLLYCVVPYLTRVPPALRSPAVAAVIVWKVSAQAFAFPSSNIMLANAAPSTRVLGTLNGVAASAASGCRAVGPTVSGVLQSAGLSVGVLGLPWWANALIAGLGAVLSLSMVEERRRRLDAEKAPPADDLIRDETPSPLDATEMDPASAAAESLNAASECHVPSSPLLTRMSLDCRRHRRDSRPWLTS